jgi:isoaspartyl peptidase/L-asparaginase-like protein (Ntn-hydrolase superfamily)
LICCGSIKVAVKFEAGCSTSGSHTVKVKGRRADGPGVGEGNATRPDVAGVALGVGVWAAGDTGGRMIWQPDASKRQEAKIAAIF